MSWSKRQRAAASAISLCTVSPLGNKPIPPGRRCFSACASSVVERRQGAGGDDVGRLRRQRPRCASAMHRRRQAGRRGDRREERRLALVALDQVHRRAPGACSAASAAMTRPGKPAPEPRSSQSAGAGGRSAPELRRVGEVPVPGVGEAGAGDTRLIRGFQLREQARGGPRAAPLFHVKHRRPRGTPRPSGSS